MLHSLQRWIESRTNLKGKIELTGFNILMLFVLGSVVGLFLETLVSYPVDGAWKDRSGFVWGPFSPIYGMGIVLFTIVLNEIHDKNPLVMFLVAGVAGGVVEYFAGLALESWYGIVAWSYVDQPFNFNHTSLFMCAVWGSAGVAWMQLGLEPAMKLINLIPQKARRPLCVVLTAFLLADCGATIASWEFWYQRLAGNPVDTSLEQLFAAWFSDAFMAQKFQTMSLYPEIAVWR